MLERIYSLMKEAQRKTQYKLSRDQALTLIKGVAGFAGSIVEKEPFASLDMAVSLTLNSKSTGPASLNLNP